jgi:hypothetical protein
MDAAGADAPEKSKGAQPNLCRLRKLACMRVEDHLLRLARIGAHEDHPAVAEVDMNHLDGRRHAIVHNDFMTPVKLVRFPWSKGQRNIGVRRYRQMLTLPFAG